MPGLADSLNKFSLGAGTGDPTGTAQALNTNQIGPFDINAIGDKAAADLQTGGTPPAFFDPERTATEMGFTTDKKLGSVQDVLQQLLEKILGDNPEARQQAIGQINRQAGRGQEALMERFAGQGTLGSGISGQVGAELEGQRLQAIGETEVSLIDKMINQALGITGAQLGVQQFGEGIRQFNVGTDLAREQLAQQQRQFNDSQSDPFSSFLGNILGIFAGPFANSLFDNKD